jgi:transcriptional regulator with XRE-family HTH domain
MTTSLRRLELKEFLRARRRSTTPEAVGLQRGKRRLVPGLRREELAMLAGVGLTWYTWLEQGRDIQVSRDALERIAQALRLSPSDADYFLALADPKPGTPARSAPQIATAVQDALDHFIGPALVISPATDVLAFNAFAEALYEFDTVPGKFARNMLWRALMDPVRRRFYKDFENGLRNILGFFRVHYARHLGDPGFDELIGDLSAHSPDFVRMWNDRETGSLAPPHLLPVRSRHFGRLNFHSVRFTLPDLPDHVLALLTPVDERTREVVNRWQAEHRDELAQGLLDRKNDRASAVVGSERR